MTEIYDAVIIGGGPAGYTAGLYCARAGLKTMVIEMLSAGGQMATTTKVENYPGYDEGIDGFDLGMKMQAQAEHFGAVSTFYEVKEVHLNENPKRIITGYGEILAKSVVIATGAVPRKLGLSNEASLVGKGVAYCATCDGMFYKGKTVAVVGGGNSAAEEATTLSRICAKVYLIHRRDSLRADKVYLDPLKNIDNLEFVWNTAVDKLLYTDHFEGLAVTNKVTGEQSVLVCDGVFAAIGREPNTALVKGQLELDEHSYIKADETGRTNIPGVFAIGDVRTKPLRQIVTAASDGAVTSVFVQEYLAQL